MGVFVVFLSLVWVKYRVEESGWMAFVRRSVSRAALKRSSRFLYFVRLMRYIKFLGLVLRLCLYSVCVVLSFCLLFFVFSLKRV